MGVGDSPVGNPVSGQFMLKEQVFVFSLSSAHRLPNYAPVSFGGVASLHCVTLQGQVIPGTASLYWLRSHILLPSPGTAMYGRMS